MSTVTVSRSKSGPEYTGVRLESVLRRARRRIQFLDMSAAALGILAAILAYSLFVITLDLAFDLDRGVRLTLWGLFVGTLGIAIVTLAVFFVRKQVSLHYAARRLEKALPRSHNGLINYVELKHYPLAPAVRTAILSQAAKEVGHTDPDQVIPPRLPLRILLFVGILVAVLVGYGLAWPEKFVPLLKRSLFPLQVEGIPTATQIKLISPLQDEVVEDPDSAPELSCGIAPGREVIVQALVSGRRPDKLVMEATALSGEALFLRELKEPADDGASEPWTIALGPRDVPVDGLRFRLLGGDARTRWYRLEVSSRQPPSVLSMEVRCQYPAYTRRPDRVQAFGPLRVMEGSRISVTCLADQPLTAAEMWIVHNEQVLYRAPMSIAADSPRKALSAEPIALRLDWGSALTYQMRLVGQNQREGFSPRYPLVIEKDASPGVRLLRVGQYPITPELKYIELPANDVVVLEGEADDDIAVVTAGYRLVLVNGEELFPLRGSQDIGPLQEARGVPLPPVRFTLVVDFNDLTTDKPQQADRRARLMVAGDRLHCRLIARDGREPEPNQSDSNSIEIRLGPPVTPQERQQHQKDAEKQAHKQPNNLPAPPDNQNQQRDKRDQQPRQDDREQKQQSAAKNDQAPASENRRDSASSKQPDDKSESQTSDNQGRNTSPERDSTRRDSAPPDDTQPKADAERKTSPKGSQQAQDKQQDKQSDRTDKQQPDAQQKKSSDDSQNRREQKLEAPSDSRQTQARPTDKSDSTDRQGQGSDRKSDEQTDQKGEQPGQEGLNQKRDRTQKPGQQDRAGERNPSQNRDQEDKSQPNAPSGQDRKETPEQPQDAKDRKADQKPAPMAPDGPSKSEREQQAGPNDKEPGAQKPPKSGEGQERSPQTQGPRDGKDNMPSTGQQKPDQPQDNQPPAGSGECAECKDQKNAGPRGQSPSGDNRSDKPQSQGGSGNQKSGRTEEQSQGKDDSATRSGKSQDGDKQTPDRSSAPDNNAQGKKDGAQTGRAGQANEQPGAPRADQKDQQAQGEAGQKPGTEDTKGKPDGKTEAADKQQAGKRPEPGASQGNPQAAGQDAQTGKPSDRNQQSPSAQEGQDRSQRSGQGQRSGDGHDAEADRVRKQAEDLARALREKEQGGQPGLGGGNGDRQNAPLEAAPFDPNRAHAEKPADLVLEEFRKKLEKGEIDRRILDKLKWSEEDLKRFYGAYEKLRKEGRLDLARGSGTAGLRSSGPSRAATQTAKPVEAGAHPAFVPPPELRDSYEEYTRRLARPTGAEPKP